MKISVVCPFFNEEPIIEKAIGRMLSQLSLLPREWEWELILVNDGSSDKGQNLVEKISSGNTLIRNLSYGVNRGRGYALKTGIEAAKGDIIVTTEIDCSWGDNIVIRLVEKLLVNPAADFVIASPNLRGGGYKNVPFVRVLLSKIGNKIIRLFFLSGITMNTGMTRAYRKDVIKGLETEEKGKEFHLEVLLKLDALGYKAVELPSMLEWKDAELEKSSRKRSTSMRKNLRLILGHLKFVLFANPLRYFWFFSLICALVGVSLEIAAVIRFLNQKVTIYVLLLGLFLLLFSLLFFAVGVITFQNKYIMKEFWKKRNSD